MAITDEIPKSRITLTYRTTVRGDPEDVVLPLRVLILGDLSEGTSRERKLDFGQRKIRALVGKNLSGVMADMNMSITLSVENKIDPDSGDGAIKVELPIHSVHSFDPAEVAKNVPKVKALLLLKRLLLEAQSNYDNRKQFRALVRALATDKDAIAAMMHELEGFDNFKLPMPKKPAAEAEGTPAT